MTVEVWKDEHVADTFQIFLLDGWTWAEFERSIIVVREFREQHTPTTLINIIINVQGPLPIPPDFEEQAPHYLTRHMQKNGGLLVFVTDWGMVHTVMKMLSNSMNAPFGFIHFTETVEEAHHIIQAQH